MRRIMQLCDPKPSSKLAEKLRAEQERRALEEKAAEAAAELAEEAQRLHKSLDVLHLGDKALRRLDSAEVPRDRRDTAEIQPRYGRDTAEID